MPAKKGAYLLQAVYDRPDDDAPRSVYADFLTERHDPRGELITLQLQRDPSPAARKQIKALLAKHEREWLGPIEPVVARGGVEYARGFVVKCEAKLRNDQDVRKYGASPAWATVQTLWHSGDASRKDRCFHWIHPVMKALREVRITSATLDLLLDAPAPWRIERLHVFDSSDALLERIGQTDKLPHLVSLSADEVRPGAFARARFAGQLRELSTCVDRREFAALIADLTIALPRLEKLSLSHHGALPETTLSRGAGGTLSQCAMSTTDEMENLVADLAAMPAGLLTSLTVTPHRRSRAGKTEHDAVLAAARRHKNLSRIDLSALNQGPIVERKPRAT
jgi:uncharacterized protein (TIGR02996 family)